LVTDRKVFVDKVKLNEQAAMPTAAAAAVASSERTKYCGGARRSPLPYYLIRLAFCYLWERFTRVHQWWRISVLQKLQKQPQH